MQHELFHEAGYRVFGLHGFTNQTCDCGNPECKAPGKHPLISNWQNVPVWSDDQWDVMNQLGHFKTGYGVLCRGLLVVDVDARNGGIASYERLLERCPEIASAGLIVETGSGGGSKHLYFTAPEDVALLAHLRDYPGVDFRSGSNFVVGPGSRHASGRCYDSVVGGPDDIDAAPAGLVELLRRPATVRVEYDGRVMDVSQADIASMLGAIPCPDDYHDWVQIGMAVHHSTAGAGFSLWDQWSQTGAGYEPDNMQAKWHSFGKHPVPVTVGTLIHRAEQNGWSRPVTIEIGEPQEGEPKDGMPVDVAGVDLRRPPGFVGKVAEWIAAQPRRKRDNLAVGAALVAVGNHVGLRMVDERDGITANLVAFGVAGSGSGKEAVQQAFAELHRETGISGAVHGAIKSDAEIYRNLMRHQAAFYNVDEISDFLEKLNNAKKRGGASYLDSVVATIMSVFTKASGYLLLTGDAKEALKEGILKEAAQEQRKLDDGRGSEQVLARLLAQADEIDKGLRYPFLSMCGYGTPEKFHALMDFRSATEGFFGRAMVFEEKDSAPRVRTDYAKTPLPEGIKDTLTQLYYGGTFDATQRRVEYTGERAKVPTDAPAGKMLDDIALWMDDQAIRQAGSTGLEAMFLRGYELVSKVSFILAAPHGLRTQEHVRWAFALVLRDLELKSMLVTANDRKMDAPATALEAKVMSTLDGEEWTSVGVIRNKCRGYKNEEIDAVLKKLVDTAAADMQETRHPVNGKVTVKYRRK